MLSVLLSKYDMEVIHRAYITDLSNYPRIIWVAGRFPAHQFSSTGNTCRLVLPGLTITRAVLIDNGHLI